MKGSTIFQTTSDCIRWKESEGAFGHEAGIDHKPSNVASTSAITP